MKACCSSSRWSSVAEDKPLKNLIATCLFQMVWSARYTTAKPPSPTSRSIRYFSATARPAICSGSRSVIRCPSCLVARHCRPLRCVFQFRICGIRRALRVEPGTEQGASFGEVGEQARRALEYARARFDAAPRRGRQHRRTQRSAGEQLVEHVGGEG